MKENKIKEVLSILGLKPYEPFKTLDYIYTYVFNDRLKVISMDRDGDKIYSGPFESSLLIYLIKGDKTAIKLTNNEYNRLLKGLSQWHTELYNKIVKYNTER